MEARRSSDFDKVELGWERMGVDRAPLPGHGSGQGWEPEGAVILIQLGRL